MGYYKPLARRIQRGQRFGANPNWGPNPPGGHNGDDYLSEVGEPIYAAGDGEVIHAGQFDSTYADNFGWNLNYGGNMVVLNLDGDTGPYVEYGHMDEVYVRAGQRVRAGQVIGTTGETDGNSGVITGPHLHVGVLPPNFNLSTNTYGRVNPDIYLTDYWDDFSITLQSESIKVQEDDMPWNEKFDTDVRGSLQNITNTIGKLPDLDRDLRARLDVLGGFERDVRADLEQKGAQIAALTAANGQLVELLATSKGLSVDEIKQALSAAIADGIKVTVEAK